jgi:hypothetical protein
MTSQETSFDFEGMAALVGDAPEIFARRRDELIQRLIAGAMMSQDLVPLQMYLDSVRYSHTPGIPLCKHLSGMMLDSVESFSLALASINELTDAEEEQS